MFALFRRQKIDVVALFETALAASRNPALYSDGGVPDTLDGRFDALLLHLLPAFRGLEGQGRAAQALYDLTFRRMELALRETGTGDMGVGKNVRRMMTALSGRFDAYAQCADDAQWEAALARNLYGTVENAQVPARVVVYAKAVAAAPVDAQAGRITYPVF